MRKKQCGLLPVINNKTMILILGSFPGKESLKKKEYYANSRNYFWLIISKLFSEEIKDYNYKQKVKLLVKNYLGLWDVVSTCYREGSEDSKIRNPEFNNISELLKKHPKIIKIYLNGRKAEQYFKKNHNNLNFDAQYLPSTSPANTGLSQNEKIMKWKKIMKSRRNR